MRLYNFRYKDHAPVLSRQWWLRNGLAATVALAVSLFVFSSGLRKVVLEKVLGGLDTCLSIISNSTVAGGRFLLYLLGLEQNGAGLASGNPAGFLNQRQLISIWLGWAGGVGVLLPGLFVVAILALLRLRETSRTFSSLDEQNSAQFKQVYQRVGQALWRNLLFDAERVWVAVVAIGVSLFLFQLGLQYYFQLSHRFVLGFVVIFTGYSYVAHIRLITRYQGIYREVIEAIEDNLCLKQGLTTLLGIKPGQAISRLYRFLLADMTQRLEKLNLTALFPHRFPRLTRYNFGFPLLIMVVLASLVTAAIPQLTSLTSYRRDFASRPAVSLTTELDETLKQEAEKLQLLSEELANNRRLQGLDYVVLELNKLSKDLAALAKTAPEVEVDGEMYAYSLSPKVFPQDNPAGNHYEQQTDYSAKPPKFSPAEGDNIMVDRRQASAPQKQNRTPSMEYQSETKHLPSPNQPPARDNRDLYYKAVASELVRLSQYLARDTDSSNNQYNQAGKWLSDRSVPLDLKVSLVNATHQLSQRGNKLSGQSERFSAEDMLDATRDPTPAADTGIPAEEESSSLVSVVSPAFVSPSLEQRANVVKGLDQLQLEALMSDEQRQAELSKEERIALRQISSELDQVAERLMNLDIGQYGLDPQRKRRLGLEFGSRWNNNTEYLNRETRSAHMNQQRSNQPEDSALPGELNRRDRRMAGFYNPQDIMVSPRQPLEGMSTEFGERALNADQPGRQAQPPSQSVGKLAEQVKVSALKLELLGEALLLVAHSQHPTPDAEGEEYIASKLGEPLPGVADPKLVQNNIPELTGVLQDARNPRNMDIITAELNKLGRELSNWQLDNQFAEMRLPSERQAPEDFKGQLDRGTVRDGGSNQADREAVAIRGERSPDPASMNNRDLERVRLENAPRHVPLHNQISNISLDPERISNELINWDARQRDSILEGADIAGNSLAPVESLARKLGLPELINSGRNRLQALANQLPGERDPRNIGRITNQMAELAQRVGSLSLDMANTLQLADNAADGTSVIQDASRPAPVAGNNQLFASLSQEEGEAAHRPSGMFPNGSQQMVQQLQQNGELLQELSTRLQPGLNPQLLESISSEMLAAFGRLEELTNSAGTESIPSPSPAGQDQRFQQMAQELRAQADMNDFSASAPESGNRNHPDTNRLRSVTELDSVSNRPGDDGLERLNIPLNQQITMNIQDALRDIESRLKQITPRIGNQEDTQQLEKLGMELVRLSRSLTAPPVTNSSTAGEGILPPDTGSDTARQLERQVRELERLSRRLPTVSRPEELRQLATELQGVHQRLSQLQDGASPQAESRLAEAGQALDRLNGELTALSESSQQASHDLRLTQLQGLGDQLQDLSRQLLSKTQSTNAAQDIAWELMNISRQLQDINRSLDNNQSNPGAGGDQSAQRLQQSISGNEERLRQLIKRLRANSDSRNLRRVGSELAQLVDEMSALDLTQTMFSKQAVRDFNSTVQELDRLSQQMLDRKATEGHIPDTENSALNQLTAELTKSYGRLRELTLSNGKLLRSGVANEVEHVDMFHGDVSVENPYQISRVASRLNELGVQLLEMDLASNDQPDSNSRLRETENTQRQSQGVQVARKSDLRQANGHLLRQQTPTEIKRQQVLNRLNQAIRQLKEHKYKLEELHNLSQGSKGRAVAEERNLRLNRETDGTESGLHFSQSSFNETNVARETNIIPESETINNAYPIEENLYQQETLERIIKRIENQKELISKVASPRSHTVQLPTYEARRREGRLSQPEGLKINRSALTRQELAKLPDRGNVPQPETTPVTEQPVSYENQNAKLKTNFAKLSIKTDELDELKKAEIPFDQRPPQQKVTKSLKLNPAQAADESVLYQQVPRQYKEIIGKIFLSG
jgi:hypothetical protein